MAHESFKLLLFHRDLEQDETCIAAGIDGLIFDLESRGKDTGYWTLQEGQVIWPHCSRL